MLINIEVYLDNEIHLLEINPAAYRNLMALLYDTICFEEFGECRGMGRCGTCLVEFLSLKKPFTAFDRNEGSTLQKMNIDKPDIYLSCQIEVNEALNGAVIKILNS